jgi:catechol 2,3-dioxygenase-like lactoylglutathione lyase family enzyme
VIQKLSHTTIWVLDQDEALDFYTRRLGFDVNADERMDDFRWVTVSPPGQPDHELILLEPGPPMMDPESAKQVRSEPADRFYGIEATLRDNSGNWFSMTQRTGAGATASAADRGI